MADATSVDVDFSAPGDPGDTGVDCAEILPLDLWVLVATELGWPDRAFFAAACDGFAGAARAAENRRAVRRRVRNWRWQAPGAAVRLCDWRCFVASASRAKAAHADLFGGVSYETVLEGVATETGRGQLGAVAEVVVERFGPPPQASRALLLMKASAAGDLETCERLADCCGLTKLPACDSHAALTEAAKGGHLDVCKWLATNCKLTPEIVRTADDQVFRFAAAHGRLAVCEWLEGHFGCGWLDRRPGYGRLVPRRVVQTSGAEAKTVVGSRIADVRLSRMALHAAAEGGDLATCQWLVERFDIIGCDARAGCALQAAAYGGHIAVCRWLADHFKLDCAVQVCATDNGTVLENAASGGHLSVCMWLFEHFELAAAGESAGLRRGALSRAAGSGHLHVCRWLVDQFGRDTWAEQAIEALDAATFGGHLEVCRWLAGQFELKRAVASAGDRFVYAAAASGRLDVCLWTAGYSDPAGAPRRSTWNIDIFDAAVKKGALDVCKWLTDVMAITAETLRDRDCYALCRACRHPPLREWMADHFDLTAADARSGDNLALHVAVLDGDLEACDWLIERFGLTVDDAIQAKRGNRREIADAAKYKEGIEWLAGRFGLEWLADRFGPETPAGPGARVGVAPARD